MAKFVMNRDFVISGMGYSIAFKKDVEINVPAALHDEAMRCGAVPVGGEESKVVHVQAAKGREAQIVGPDREKSVIAAMDALVEGNERMSFGADALPTIKAIYRITGIDLDLQERDEYWQKRVRALRAISEPNNTTITDNEMAEANNVRRDTQHATSAQDPVQILPGLAAAEGDGTASTAAVAPPPKRRAPPRKKASRRK